MRKEIFPFTALVGQEEMKKALVLNAVNPRIGGVLIRGEKGTAKSTAVRGLAELLPEIRVVAGCPFGCDPEDVTVMCAECRRRREAGEELPTATRKMRVVDLPVSATEDRVVGTLDIEHAIKKGEKRFEPGVLAEANRGILYVDEVNLLDDHVVDVLLDAAAMGVNTVEREGVSFTHPAQFILVGTMNPEEGELRPQLLDRFGLCVNITGVTDPALRAEIVKRCLSFEEDPAGFAAVWEEEQQRLREKIVAARRTLPQVDISDEMLLLIARTAIEMRVDGHRADLIMMKAAKTNAALGGRTEVTEADIKETANFALLHRMRRKPFQEVAVDQEKLAGILGLHPHRQGGKQVAHSHPHTHTHSHPHQHPHSHAHTHQHGHPHGHEHGRG
ncbi:MAG: ATP-binding protein [Bacillota bacterium]